MRNSIIQFLKFIKFRDRLWNLKKETFIELKLQIRGVKTI